MSPATPSPNAKGMASWIPAINWLKTYQPVWLRADLLAAITLAASVSDTTTSGPGARARDDINGDASM